MHRLTNCSVSSVYNYNDLSLQELLCRFNDDIKECVELSTNTNKTIHNEVGVKLNEWLNNGTIEEIINTELFNDLKGKLNNITIPLTTNGVDDSTQLINLLLLGVRNIKLVGELTFLNTVTLPSNTTIHGDMGKIKSLCGTLFYIPSSTENIVIENMYVNNELLGDTTFLKLEGGETGGYEATVKNVLIKNVIVNNFTLGIDIKRGRKINIENVNIWCHNGVYYHHKSAEVNIINSYIVQNKLSDTSSYGLWCYSDGDKYPEGLTVTNTLFYQFDTNIKIDDLYVGNFTNCHIDGSNEKSINNIELSYNVKNDRVNFNGCWIYKKGIKYNGGNNVKAYRSHITNCMFDMIEGVAITFKKWVHDVMFTNSTINGDNKGTDRIAAVMEGMHEYIIIDNVDIKFFDNYIINNGECESSSFTRISGNSSKQSPIYSAAPVTIDNVGLSNISKYSEDIKNINLVNGVETLRRENILISSGTHIIKLVGDNCNTTKEGHIRLSVEGDNIQGLSGELTKHSFIPVENNGKYILECPIVATKPTRITIKVYADGINGSFGWFSRLMLIKM